MESVKELGESLEVEIRPAVEFSPDPHVAIVEFAKVHQMDLILLGTQLRPGSTHLFFGKGVEYILQNATCPVVIINSI